MRLTVEYPVSGTSYDPGYDPALLSPEGIVRVARAVESSGLDAIAFTDHPAPSRRWLDNGGHETLDVTAALSFCAAVTERVRLMSHLLVLPYRNPFLTAKSVATVDLLSGGRMTMVAGAGYLKSEFRALGVDFAERNELFDEALEVLRGAWSRHPYSHSGRHFQAEGVAVVPGPVQGPAGPPIWIGGNSVRARRRAALHQGWSPMMLEELVARTSRTPALRGIEELATAVAQVRDAAVEAQGEGTRLEIQLSTRHSGLPKDGGSLEEFRDHLGALAGAGATWFVVRPPAGSIAAAVEAIERCGEAVAGV